MTKLSKGLIIKKKFKIIGFLEKDFLGSKYKAVYLPNQRLAVIRLIPPEYHDIAKNIIENYKQLEGFIHKIMVESLGGGYIDPEKKVPYVASVFVEGDKLSDIIKKQYPLGAPLKFAKLVVFHISKLFEDVHSHFEHGFLTPSSIIISTVGRIKVADFGFSGFINTMELLDNYSSAFIAPEIKNKKSPDYRSDIYSLAVICNYIISGRKPDGEGNPDLKKDTPQGIFETLKNALSELPQERHPDTISFYQDFEQSFKMKKKVKNSVIMVDLLESFQEESEEEKKYMVQKGRLDYGPYCAREIREKALDQEIMPNHIIVNIDTGSRKQLEKHPDFDGFMEEFLRRMELNRREEVEKETVIQEKRQSRTFKLSFILGIAIVVAVVLPIVLYQTVVSSDKSSRKTTSSQIDDNINVISKSGDKNKKKQRSKRRRHRRRRRKSNSSSSEEYSGSSGKKLEVYALDSVNLSRTQINSVVHKGIINKIARKCIPSKGSIKINYQIGGRQGKIRYTSARLNGKPNKKIARCAHGVLRKLRFPKKNTDISGFGGIRF
ncbi:MAG: protein kinase [Deltaproteobacteria bacterium]|jgi:serine/threonine protein kinase|nr:protein kinase [Deltaproteobacteria bacterium]